MLQIKSVNWLHCFCFFSCFEFLYLFEMIQPVHLIKNQLLHFAEIIHYYTCCRQIDPVCLTTSSFVVPFWMFKVSLFVQIPGLMEVLDHPIKRYFPVIHLPFEISQQLLHSKKYVQSFMECCALLAEMGLLSFGREVLKDKEQVSLLSSVKMIKTLCININ